MGVRLTVGLAPSRCPSDEAATYIHNVRPRTKTYAIGLPTLERVF
jgi:hypothetical protein